MTFIGSISITNITGSAIVQFGNTFKISQISSSSSTEDSGSENSGALSLSYPMLRSASSNSKRVSSRNRKRSISMESTSY